MSDPALSELLDVLSAATVDKFSTNFCVHESHYRSSKGQIEIDLHILVPRNLIIDRRSQKRPLILRIHGGYLVTGSSLYPPWFTTWILDFAKQNGAIIVSPNYRLMPEATGSEILEDMDALWSWMHDGGVDTVLQEKHQGLSVDLERTILIGESAGGYLAMQLALSHHQGVRALIAAYPVLDLRSKFFTDSFAKPIMQVPNRPISLLNNHLMHMRSIPRDQKHAVIKADPPERLELSFAIVQNGRYLEFLGDDRILYPMDRIADRTDADGRHNGANLPKMFIFHGESDSAVPAEGSRHFVEELKEKRPLASVHLEIQPGDHGFDYNATLETPWLRNGLKRITEAWLKMPNSQSGGDSAEDKI